VLGTITARAERSQIGADPNQVTTLVARNQLRLDQPLRWRGTLAIDPLESPWGVRYQLDLESFQSGGEWHVATGGLRADYYFPTDAHQGAPDFRAGDRVEVLTRARPVRNFGDPGAFDFRTYLARQGIDLTSTIRSTELLERIDGHSPTIGQRLARLRGRLLRQTDTIFASSENAAALLRSMLLGDRSFLDSAQIEPFQQTGAYHVLVLSGLQIGVLAALLMWVARRVHLPRLLQIVCTLVVLWGYTAVAEERLPVLRAVSMATVYLLAYGFFRRTHVLNALGIAGIFVLLWRPSELGDAGFLLSFSAVAAIGGIAAPWLERTATPYLKALDQIGDVTRDAAHAPKAAQFRLDLRAAAKWLANHLPGRLADAAPAFVTAPLRMGLWLWETIVISAAIQLAMLPLMAQYFHRVSLLGLAANVPAVLLTGIIVPLGFLSQAAAAISQPLASVFVSLLHPLVRLLLWCIQRVATLPHSSYRVPAPPTYISVAFFAALALLAAAIILANKWATLTIAGVVAVLAAVVAIHPFAPSLHRQDMEVTLLDVGQGDALFLAFPDGKTMLLDGGGLAGGSYIRSRRPGIDVGEDVVSPFLWSRGLKRLDVVALTHAHQDHLDGLSAVLRNFQVGELWIGRDIESSAFHALLRLAGERNIRIVHKKRGDQMQWADVRMSVLWPKDDESKRTAENNDSLVLRLETGRQSLLLTGDIERAVERTLDDDGDTLTANFLKIPHHGSRTSTTEPFFQAVHPQIAAISVGENNPFGHPNADVIDRIESSGTRLYRTDRDGAITILTDGQRMDVQTYLSPR
jgi:competence protein ComEC